MTRRQFIVITGSAFAWVEFFGCRSDHPQADGDHKSLAAKVPSDLQDQFAAIEARVGGRLGVALLDTHTGAEAGHRANERFAMCSTSKLLIVAATLSRVDNAKESLDRRIPIAKTDLLDYSPITKNYVGEGMTVRALCEAAITVSDNTAANLLLQRIGGPAAFTAYARSIDDTQTRLDRTEPELNEAAPGDPRDTTTPMSMLNDLRLLMLGGALKPESRQLLLQWLEANTTGNQRIRAGLPATWHVADKTGSGEHGTTNDIAVIWPPNRKPLLLCVYLTGSPGASSDREAAIASTARAVTAYIQSE